MLGLGLGQGLLLEDSTGMREDSRGVIGQVQEKADIPHGTILLEVGLEEPGCLHVHLDTQQGELEAGPCDLRTGTQAPPITSQSSLSTD